MSSRPPRASHCEFAPGEDALTLETPVSLLHDRPLHLIRQTNGRVQEHVRSRLEILGRGVLRFRVTQIHRRSG